ncbi:DEAD/DEAH box helicase [Psychrobacter sp. FDAARGOS_221]|uniref:DEAD/DEAH box helicase n=1 Tax=Psychrobacter sp. FDAARGOS_221 TaxID=1975705 RepID=UPI000BB58E56|nr:DEAD/DEAH box helicase [Psychrobacter sp. FDAARGOS_221]PNK59597.1 ATP-dependent helicase [Psychrobacter sp. FDAARGOS_221]
MSNLDNLLNNALTDTADAENAQGVIQSDDDLSFVDLELAPELIDALTASGYTMPTPIQAQAIPPAMAGRDLLLSAQTGSGKTAAFVLPMLDKIIRDKATNKVVHTVILTPTRELANQVSDSVRQYSSKTRNIFSVPLVGGAPYGGQIRALNKGVQVIIATPGRFIDHMNSGRIDLSELDILILDEADRMLDMGFAEDIEKVMKAAPKTRQTIMCSATWDGPVGKIAASFTNNPERIDIKAETKHIDETVYYADDFNHKNRLLDTLLTQKDVNQAIIFAATKRSCETLAKSLKEQGHKASFLHGDLPQAKRSRIINDVKSGKITILVATDVAARGIDVSGITHVFNYDLPRQTEDYVHRIGRSGRAGRTGIAINICSIDDRPQLEAINRYLKRTMSVEEIEGMEPKKNTKDMKVGSGAGRGRGGNRRGGGPGAGNRRGGNGGGGYRGKSADNAGGERRGNGAGRPSGKPTGRRFGKPAGSSAGAGKPGGQRRSAASRSGEGRPARRSNNG